MTPCNAELHAYRWFAVIMAENIPRNICLICAMRQQKAFRCWASMRLQTLWGFTRFARESQQTNCIKRPCHVFCIGIKVTIQR